LTAKQSKVNQLRLSIKSLVSLHGIDKALKITSSLLNTDIHSEKVKEFTIKSCCAAYDIPEHEVTQRKYAYGYANSKNKLTILSIVLMLKKHTNLTNEQISDIFGYKGHWRTGAIIKKYFKKNQIGFNRVEFDKKLLEIEQEIVNYKKLLYEL
jgi:hypothetical protein